MWKSNSPQSTAQRNFMWRLSVFPGDRTGSLASSSQNLLSTKLITLQPVTRVPWGT